MVPNSSLSMVDALERTILRRQEIEAAGYQVVEMWGCNWEAEKKRNKDLKQFLKNFNYDIYLKPRDALCGVSIYLNFVYFCSLFG